MKQSASTHIEAKQMLRLQAQQKKEGELTSDAPLNVGKTGVQHLQTVFSYDFL